MSKVIAISACLLGLNTKYNGENNYNINILPYIKDKTILPICPEVFGGLSTPRPPSEINMNNKVLMKDEKDVTNEFNKGAIQALNFLKKHGCDTVILKNGSPSCGLYTYDGTFSKTKIDRMGIASKLLKENKIRIIYID